MKLLYLARHGETDWNVQRRWQGQTDIHLNPTGRRQAHLLAEILAGFPILRVYTSDLARARETGEIAAEALGLPPVQTDPDLRERNFGAFEGLTFEECAKKLPEMWAAYRGEPRRLPDGAEPEVALAARMARAIGRILRQDETSLVVTHGGSARVFLHGLALKSPELGGMTREDFALGNCAVFELGFVKGPEPEFPFRLVRASRQE